LKKRDETITAINKIKAEREMFETRKNQVLENGEEWTEGDFNQPIPREPEKEIDNDIE